jgi:hypothetical protein
VVFGLAMVGCAVGGWGLGPYLTREMRRLEPWKVVLVWFGTATALVWFVVFMVEYLVRGQPLRVRPWDSFKREKEWLLAVGSLLLSCGTDLAVTLHLMHEDRAAFQTAQVVQGQAVAMRAILHPRRNRYDLDCTFTDLQVNRHEARFLVSEDPVTGFPAAVPPATVQALRAGQAPVPLRISYDPAWPDRSWATDFGWDDGNRLHYFSLIVLVMRGGVLLLLVEFMAMVTYHTGRVPWWFDLHKALPFLVEVAFAAVVGPFMRLSGVWVWV